MRKNSDLKRCYRSAGFTLVELMIVVAIIGILAAVAYPSYVKNIEGGRISDAQGGLVSFANAMEKYYARNNTFIGTSAAIPGPPLASLFPSELPIEGNRKFYDLTIEAATVNTFTLRATPKGPQVGTGFLELDSTGARRWNRYNAGVLNSWN